MSKNRFLTYVALASMMLCLVNSCQRKTSYYIDAGSAAGLRKMLRYTGDNMYLLSSHRGGPEPNYPENCIATFENTLRHCYSMMEIDPRYTKDSVIIVHHDNTLERTTTGKGQVADFTFTELQQLRLKDKKGNATDHRLQTLDEMLQWAKGKTILVLDRKNVSVEERARKITEHHAESCAIVMAYNFQEAQACYRLNPDMMMQVFIKDSAEIVRFEQTGVPWENVVVFIGHQNPEDMSVCRALHEKGVLCIRGTSRNLDREFIEGKVDCIEALKTGYHALYDEGVDIIETDIPVPLGSMIKQRIHLLK